jgi:hypothetical protein
MRKIRRILAAGAALALLAGVGAASAASTSSAPSNYVAQASTRVLDTRTSNTPLAAGHTVVVDTKAPASATAVTVNLTVTGVTGGGYVVAYGDGSAKPDPASSVNFGVGQTVANETTVAVTDGKIDVYSGAGSGSVQLIVDVLGYYTATAAAYAPAATSSAHDTGGETVVTGGSFSTNAQEVATLALAAGSYEVSVGAKATPAAATGAVEVFPQFFVYNQVKNPAFTGDEFNVGSGALESGANNNIDSYFSGSGLVTVPSGGETLHVYAFGYDSDRSAGSYTLDNLSITAVPVTVPAS